MRLLHPKTISLIASSADAKVFATATSSKKQILSHAWSEVFKFMKSGKSHPKMFISSEYDLGVYAAFVYKAGTFSGCNLNPDLIYNYSSDFVDGFLSSKTSKEIMDCLGKYFDTIYFFSDLNSLYYKGVNLFKVAYPEEWRKYVPVESLKEIQRQVEKSVAKGCK